MSDMLSSLVTAGRGISVFGVLLIVLLLLSPPALDRYLDGKSAWFGALLAGIAAITVGFVLATVGG